MAIPITEIKGVGPLTADKLTEHGYRNAEDVATAQADDLATISGFGYVRAKLVIESAKNLTSEVVEPPASEQAPEPTDDSNRDVEVQKQEPNPPKKKSTKKKEKKAKKKKKDKADKKDKKAKKAKKKK